MKNYRTTSPRRRLVLLGASLAAAAFTQVSAQTILIEENFDEAALGGRITAGEHDLNPINLCPGEGTIHAFPGDEAEIVDGWSKNALQFQDQVADAALKLNFGAGDIDPITRGKLKVSFEFQITGEAGVAPHAYDGNPLVVTLSAPTQAGFLTVTIYRENGKIYHTNSEEAPSWVNMAQGVVMNPGMVYRIQLDVSLDQASYDITVMEKESGWIACQATDQKYVPIPDLAANGLRADLLSVQAGSPDFSRDREPPIRVTIDNVCVSYTQASE